MPFLRSTQQWVSKAITTPALYGRALCPFSKEVLPKLRLSVSPVKSDKELMDQVSLELDILMNEQLEQQYETSLLVVPHMFHDNYRSMIHFSWDIMERITSSENLQGKLQVINFHPKAVHSLFAEGPPDGADYSIRSPYPTFHLLKESSILRAVQSSYPNPELIPSRNAKILRELGSNDCKRLFDTLRQEQTE